MEVLGNINSYRIGKSLIRINEGIDFRLDSKYIVLNYDENRVEETRVFKEFFHFTNDSKYLLFGTDSKVYNIDDRIFCDIKSYEITDNYGIISNKERLYNLYSFSQKKSVLKKWLPNRIYHIQDQYWCNDTKEDFKLIDVDSGEILWTIPQPKVEKPYGYNGLTNIRKVLGIHKNNLWIQLPDSRLWAVDIETGKINNEIEHFYFSAIPEGIFLSQAGRIIIFHYNIYAEYSLDSNEFITDKVISDENELIIRNVLFRENDTQLYFTGNKDNSFYPNVYGVFNREKLSFEFMGEQLTENSFFYQTPQVNDELFTILDSEGNLVIHKMQDILTPKN